MTGMELPTNTDIAVQMAFLLLVRNTDGRHSHCSPFCNPRVVHELQNLLQFVLLTQAIDVGCVDTFHLPTHASKGKSCSENRRLITWVQAHNPG
jgi:hypothetical protein